jgi:hypothetical protein
MKTLGTILLAFGILMTVSLGFEIITERSFTDIKPEEINNPNKMSLFWSPITAVALLASGTLVLIIVKKESRVPRKHYRRAT